MYYIDMHCDTLLLLANPERRATLRDSGCAVDLTRLARGGAMAQFFAVFLPQPEDMYRIRREGMTDEAYIELTTRVFREGLAASADIAAPALTASDVERNARAGLVSAVLTMEDGRAVGGDMEKLERFFAAGFRAIALTWNYANCFGCPNSDDSAEMARGLTPFGREAVTRMNELGMLVDVSHLSEGGFWDVARLAKRPFIASHSNARALSPHRRNLTDAQLRALGEAGGVTGLNFCPAFLNADTSRPEATARRLAEHARHIVDVAGIESCGLGSDLDGTGGELEIDTTDKMQLLWDALSAAGFSGDEVERIAWRNALRVMKEAIG